MTDDYCDAPRWVEDLAQHAVCTLPPSHEGAHWDSTLGVDW